MVPEYPPNFWAHLRISDEPTEEEENRFIEAVESCNKAHDDWMASEKGIIFLAWDKAVVMLANEKDISYVAAMALLLDGAN